MKSRRDEPGLDSGPMRTAVQALVWSERAIFFAIGILLFAASLALLKEAVVVLGSMFSDVDATPIVYGSEFLDVILLVLMIVELAYTVILSLQGAVLLAEPFLIVGLIAVIRRILVITVGEKTAAGSSVMHNDYELLILTAVVIVFVGSIFILRQRPRREPRQLNAPERPE